MTRHRCARNSDRRAAHAVRGEFSAYISLGDRGRWYGSADLAAHAICHAARLRNLDSPAFDISLPTRAPQFGSDVRLVRDYLERIVGVRAATWMLRKGLGLVLSAGDFVSLVIELALALPMVWYFHRSTTMSLPANVTCGVAASAASTPWQSLMLTLTMSAGYIA